MTDTKIMEESQEEFKIGQLTKELVAIKLKKMADPCATAANLVKQTLSVAMKGLKQGDAGQGELIEDACRGGITGLLLAEQNLGKGAVLILEAVAELSSELNLDPTEMMRSALKGIADMRRFLRTDQLYAIHRDIEMHFMGAGEVFAQLIQVKPEAKPQP